MPEPVSDENTLHIPSAAGPADAPQTPEGPGSAAAGPVPPAVPAPAVSPVPPASPASPAAPESPAPPAVPAPPAAVAVRRPAPRVRTMVFGLILAVIAGCVLITQVTGAHLDAGAVALTVMVIAGLMLIAGGRRNSG